MLFDIQKITKLPLFMSFILSIHCGWSLQNQEDASESLTHSNISEPFLQLSSLDSKSLDTIVSTSNYLPTLISEAPGNVSSIDSKSIALQNSKQLSDVLSRSAGVRMDKDTGYNGRPQIFVRGIPFGTIVMVDGIILNDLEGEFRIIQAISPQDIDRIEIVRGAFSSLYGTGGIGGVINILTKSPTKREGYASLGYGNELVFNGAEKNFIKGYFHISDVFFDHRLRLSASYGFTSSDGAYRRPAFAILPAGSSTSTTFRDGRAIADGDVVGQVGRTAYLTQDFRLKGEFDWNDVQTTSLIFSLSTVRERQHSPISEIKNSDGTTYAYSFSNSDGTSGFYNPFLGTGWAGFREQYNLVGSLGHKIYFSDDAHLEMRVSSVNLINYWDDGCDGMNCLPATSPDGTRTPDSITQGKNAYIFGGRGYSVDNFASSNYLDVVYTNRFNDVHSLVVGFQGRALFSRIDKSYGSDFSSPRFYKHYDFLYAQDNSSAVVLALFANWQSHWLKSLTTNFGLRFDYWRSFNLSSFDLTSLNLQTQRFDGVDIFFPSPKFAINYSPWKYTTFKSSLGLAFRAPSSRQIFSYAHLGSYQISNPNLKPEYGFQFDAGVEQKNPYGGSLNVYYFNTQMFNGIYKAGEGSLSNPFQNLNGAYVSYSGVEIEAWQKIYRDLSFVGSYTYTRAVVVRTPFTPHLNGNKVPSVPPHMASIGLVYGAGRGFFSSLYLRTNSSAFSSLSNVPVKLEFGNITARAVFDFKIGYEFKNQTRLSLSFLNFTNELYYDFYRGSGASFYLELASKLF